MRLVLVLLALLFSLTGRDAWAVERSSAVYYENLEVLQQAMKADGQSTDILEMLRIADITQKRTNATSLQLLQLVAREFKCNTHEFSLLTLTELQATQVPLILTVKSAIDAPDSDQKLILLLPGARSDAHIWSGGKEYDIPWEQLLQLWNRHALLVSRQVIISRDVNFRMLHLDIAYILVAVVSVIASILRGRQYFVLQSASGLVMLKQIAIIIATVIGFSGIGYFSYVARFWTGPFEDTSHRSNMFIDFRNEMPISTAEVVELNAVEFKVLQSQHSILFVDARPKEEFAVSRVRGSIGLPSFTESQIRLSLVGVPKDMYIVVYCADAQCPRGRAATASLLNMGYSHAVNFTNGWKEFSHSNLVEIDVLPVTITESVR